MKQKLQDKKDIENFKKQLDESLKALKEGRIYEV